MTPHQQTLGLANSLPLWVFCIVTVGLVFVQAFVYARVSMRYAKTFGVTASELRNSAKSGVITTLGPALSIFVVGLGLMSQIGVPLTLSRLSVIGNATYEASAAEMGAAALGASISSDSYTMAAFACSVWVMNLGGIAMLLMPLLLTKPLCAVTDKVSGRGSLGMVVGISASLASFGFFSVDYAVRDLPHLTSVLVAFGSMTGMCLLSKRYRIGWLKDWALGFAIILSVVVALVFFGEV